MRLRRRAAGLLLAIVLSLGAVVQTGCLQEDPLTGRSHLNLVPAGQINALGEEQYGQYLAEHELSSDAAAQAMVRRVGARIRDAVESYLHSEGLSDRLEGFEWQFNLIESEEVNAFCMPGGRVAVMTGLLPVVEDEEGLAVVVAHEIAHAVARHSQERMSQALLISLGGIALNQALDEKGDRTRALFMGLYGAGSTVGFVLPHGRSQEYEADRLGLRFMAMAGYDPRAAVRVWKAMAARGGARPPEILSTHPTDANRIEAIERLLPDALAIYRRG